MLDVKELSNKLSEQASTVAERLLPGGKQSGREWVCGSVHGEPGQSLKVCISGDKRGVWKDFASGEGGDLIDLWMAVRGLAISEAIREIKDYLGISEPQFAGRKQKKFRKPQSPVNTSRVTASNESAVMKYLTEERKLTVSVLDKYKICETTQVGPWKGWKRQEPWTGPFITFPYLHPDNTLISIKYLHLKRKEGKKVTLVESNCQPTLFGWHAIDPSARTITICEGELDAPSLHQYGYPALSVPFGAGGGDKQQWVDYDWDLLERFDKIYLAMDADEEGSVAVKELIRRLGQHRCFVVTLPRKDANLCLQEGVPREEIEEAYRNAKHYEPEELKSAKAYYREVLDEFYPAGGKLPGWDMPYEGMGAIRFLRGEVSLMTGVNGHGKSLILGELMMHAAMQGERCCIASLEMAPRKTLHRMVTQACAAERPRHVEIEECMNWMGDKVWLFDLVGTGKVERMLEVFRYAYRRHGVKQFVIDSLAKCGIAEDDYRAQKEMVEKLCDFVTTCDAHIHLIAHPRKADDETPPGKMDVKGTGAITDLVWNVFSIWRNKPKERTLSVYNETGELPRGVKDVQEVIDRPDVMFYCHKARNLRDAEGAWALWYDPRSMRYLKRPTQAQKVLYEAPEGQAPF